MGDRPLVAGADGQSILFEQAATRRRCDSWQLGQALRQFGIGGMRLQIVAGGGALRRHLFQLLPVRLQGGVDFRQYRLVFQASPEPMAFHGTYLEVTPPSRLAWTNEESFGSGQVTTVTFEEKAGRTLLGLRELYPSKAALDDAIASGSTSGDMEETFNQLDELLAAQGAAVARP